MFVHFVPVLAAANIIDVFEHCDVVGQTITGGLAVGSVIAWAVMFGKKGELSSIRRLNHQFERHLREIVGGYSPAEQVEEEIADLRQVLATAAPREPGPG